MSDSEFDPEEIMVRPDLDADYVPEDWEYEPAPSVKCDSCGAAMVLTDTCPCSECDRSICIDCHGLPCGEGPLRQFACVCESCVPQAVLKEIMGDGP